MAKFKLVIQDQEQEISVARQGSALHVRWDSRDIECQLRQQDGLLFVLEVKRPDGKRHTIRAAGSATGDDRQLWTNGQMVVYRRIRQRRIETGHSGSLAATIPAIVSAILVAPGDHVSADQKLLLLESMKMIIPIQAPHDGLVTAVHCAVGESVQAGVHLIELTQEEES